MAITITATVGSASANALVTEAEAIAYVATRLNSSTWTTTSGATCTETEKAAIIEATRELGNLTWQGDRADDTQALAWPRDNVTNPDNPYGDTYDSDVIPQRVKDACCELAFQFIKSGTTDVAALDSLTGITEKTIDVITTRYSEYSRPTGLARYPRVLSFIKPLLAEAGPVVRTIRG